MIEKDLLVLVEKYQSLFGHRIPNWAGRIDTKEKIAAAIAAGEPVKEWRDYRPNPQNFFALADSLRREVTAKASDTKSPVKAGKAIQYAKMLVPKFSCQTADGWHIQWPKDDPHVVFATTQEELVLLLATWLRELGRVGNEGPHVAAENGCATCR